MFFLSFFLTYFFRCFSFLYYSLECFLILFDRTFFFIIKVFRTIVFIFIVIVISTTLWLICPPAFFRCLSNSGTFTELRTTSFIETTGVACSDSVCHNWVQVLKKNNKKKNKLKSEYEHRLKKIIPNSCSSS